LQKRLSGLDRRVVAVHTYGDMGADLFIEMEFIDGDDLSALMARLQITYPFAFHNAHTHTRKKHANVFRNNAYCSNARIETQNMDTQYEMWSVGVLLSQMIAH